MNNFGTRFIYHNKFYLRSLLLFHKVTIKRFFGSYYVTTPIYYVNAQPHIGHLYSSLVADAIARFQKLKNPDLNIKFMTGTDEHGLKISLSSKANNMDEITFCNKVSQKYKDLFDLYDITYTDYLRTTEDRHRSKVTELWNTIYDKGYIYVAEHKGWYCVSDETFVTEVNLKPKEDSESIRYTNEDKPVQYITEINYKFKLSHFQNDLLYWLKGGSVVKPEKFHKILQKMVEDEEVVSDLSVSRPTSRVKWGIPVPNDASQNIYVWLDALCSYLTSSEYPKSKLHWPPDLHVIGKDILRFHGVYWPAFLMAAGLEPPKCILCHSHWLNEGKKMSKSLGNVIDPMHKAELYTSDGFRYYLLCSSVPHSDGNYNESEIIPVVNADLADKLGNLLNRCCSKALNLEQVFPHLNINHSVIRENLIQPLIQSLDALPEMVSNYYEDFEFSKGIHAIMSTIMLANKMFQDSEPWKLKKNREGQDEVRAVLHFSMESLRVCGILLQPIIPKTSENLLNRLSVKRDERNFDNIKPFSWQRSTSTSIDIPLTQSDQYVFRKLESKWSNRANIRN